MAAIILACGLAATTEAQEGPLSLVSFVEREKQAATISGSRVLGFVSAEAPARGAAAPDISAWIPAGWAGGAVCLRVFSADGLYEAVASHRVAADWGGGRARFAYPTGQPEKVLSMPAAEVAVLATKDECGAETGEAALAFWNGGGAAGAALLLNSFRAEETLIYLDGAADSEPLPCGPVAAETRAAFDTRCPIPEAEGAEGALSLTVLTVKGGRLGKPFALVLHRGS